MALSSIIMTLILCNEVLEKTDITSTLIGCTISIYDFSIDSAWIIVAIWEVSSKFPMWLIMIFLCLSPLINYSCPVKFHSSNNVRKLIFLVDCGNNIDTVLRLARLLSLCEMVTEVIVFLVLGMHLGMGSCLWDMLGRFVYNVHIFLVVLLILEPRLAD